MNKVKRDAADVSNKLTIIVENQTDKLLPINAAELNQPEVGLAVDLVVIDDNEILVVGGTPGTLDGQLVSTIISILGLLVSVWSAHRQQRKDSEWDKEKALKKVADQMIERDVVEYSVERVENFKALTKNGGGPCVFTVVAKGTSDRYQIYVFADGNARTMRITRGD